jgi:16S rRNA G1207 methylase RsmC
MFKNRRYLEFLQAYQLAFEADNKPVTHEAYGFPLTLYPGVYPCDPRYTHSASVILDRLPPRLDGRMVLDIGTGNGVLAIEAARRGARVTACDVSEAAVLAARANAEANGFAEQIDVLKSDLFASLPLKRYDLITANLWFPIDIRGYDRDRVESLEALRRLLGSFRRYLFPQGTLMISSADFADQVGVQQAFRVERGWPNRSKQDVVYQGKGVKMTWYCYIFEC